MVGTIGGSRVMRCSCCGRSIMVTLPPRMVVVMSNQGLVV